ncbi:hypothetical protein AXFE_28400 [Acidithrix ferrooxidans]|uniref:Uncharacterized protein n=1 Tax=Acidithrix ferrooxidans TaxID=1280514 RepID=A0A0D8HEX7_9ACTN|nr:hypothetical protein AXFE_28400 [Acidithrix ferrooxidans]
MGARDALANRVSLLQAALEFNLGDFGSLLDKERIVGSLYRAMADYVLLTPLP